MLERRPEHREVQRNPVHPNAFGLHAQLADHQFDCAVGGLGGAAHQVERCTAGAPRDQRQHRDDGVLLDCLDQQAVAVGGVAEPAQRHREAALSFGVPPRVGPLDHLGHLLAAEVAVPSDPNGCACPPRPRHRLPHRAHVVPGEPEVVRIQDRFVAQLQRVEAGLAEGLGPRRAGTHHPGRPAVRLAQRQPRINGLLPCLWVADRVAAGQTDTDLDAIGDRRPPVGREHDRLVAAGGEIAQRVVLAEQLEEAPDRGFVLAGERVLGVLRLEQHDRGHHQRESAEEAEQRIDEHVRVAAERIRVGACKRAHPVERVQEPVFSGQAAREQLQQRPPDERADRHARDQRACRFEERSAADLRPELLAGQHQEQDGRDVEDEPDHFADVVHHRPVAGDQGADVPHDRTDHVAHQDPPGDALASSEGRRQQRQDEGPREAGVGEVEDVVVDELARFLDEPPDAGRHARDQRQGGDDADRPAGRRGHP